MDDKVIYELQRALGRLEGSFNDFKLDVKAELASNRTEAREELRRIFEKLETLTRKGCDAGAALKSRLQTIETRPAKMVTLGASLAALIGLAVQFIRRLLFGLE